MTKRTDERLQGRAMIHYSPGTYTVRVHGTDTDLGTFTTKAKAVKAQKAWNRNVVWPGGAIGKLPLFNAANVAHVEKGNRDGEGA